LHHLNPDISSADHLPRTIFEATKIGDWAGVLRRQLTIIIKDMVGVLARCSYKAGSLSKQIHVLGEKLALKKLKRIPE